MFSTHTNTILLLIRAFASFNGCSWQHYLTLPLTAYWNLVMLQGGASEAPHKISRKESSLTPCCYIAFVRFIFRGHMQKFGPKYQNLSEISGLKIFVKLRFRITLTSERWL